MYDFLIFLISWAGTAFGIGLATSAVCRLIKIKDYDDWTAAAVSVVFTTLTLFTGELPDFYIFLSALTTSIIFGYLGSWTISLFIKPKANIDPEKTQPSKAQKRRL